MLDRISLFGGYVSGSRILWHIYSNADIFIGGRFLKSRELGAYSVALNLSSIPLDKFTPIINQVAFSAYSIIRDERNRVTGNFLKSVRIVSLVVFPVCWGIAAIAPEFIAMFGSKWKEAILPIQIMSLIMPFRAVGTLLAPVLQGIGSPRVHFFNVTIMTAIFIPLFLFGIKWGIIGLSISWLAGYAAAFVWICSRSMRAIGVRMAEFISAMSTPVIGGLVMLTLVLLIKNNLHAFPPLTMTAFAVMLGTVAYISAVFLLNQDTLREFAYIFKAFRKKEPEF